MPRKKKYFEDQEINDLFHEWLKMRRLMRKPATDYAIQLAIKHLREKSDNKRSMAIEMLQESIQKNWLDFYPKQGLNGKEYTYSEVCNMVAKDGFTMDCFERIDKNNYRKIK